VIYRPYTPADFDALYALEERCFEPPHRFSRRYLRSLVNRATAATWITEEDGQMTGFAIVEWSKRTNETAAYIQTIEVAPEARGHGIGRELLGHIEGSSTLAGAAHIWLHVDAANASAIQLYESQGYRCEGRKENYYLLGGVAFIYRKRLDLEEISQKE
jgi:ribosomal protein S18 acetylase RimI-like enzyme